MTALIDPLDWGLADGDGGGDRALAAALAEDVSAGLLSRQERVSMLPVMALRVPAGSCVLDVCASPGQKGSLAARGQPIARGWRSLAHAAARRG